MKKIIIGSIVASSVLMAGGYRIPEASLNAVALSAANIAHVKTADAAYYNPANMVFMSDENHLEADIKYLSIDASKFTPTDTTASVIESKSETFLIPSLHYVSGKLGNARVGISLVSPGGLSKRWDVQPAKSSAEEFTLETIELNPTVAIPVNDTLAVAFGFRIVSSNGIVKSNNETTAAPTNTSRDMSGDSVDFGYNLALAYKPTSDLEIGVTYRSQINLTIEGNAKLHTDGVPGLLPAGSYDGDASLTVPLPAVFDAAIAYTLPTKTTIEFVYEKTYWSAYEEIDFKYASAITNPILAGGFATAKPKNWEDTIDYRLGITQELDSMTLMAGMVYSESPAPEKTLGYELPDSNSLSVSLGGRYHVSDKLDIGMAALYSMREDRTVSATVNDGGLDGEFTGSNVLIISAGLGYKF